METKEYDRIILGAGIYGLYAATKCGKNGESVLVLEYDPTPFSRATSINQARIHMGYHYPRSLSTAKKSANYYRRFHDDFGFAIHDKFMQVYATSASFSWTNAEAFKQFCEAANIKCEELSPSVYFKNKMCDGAFLTEEDTYDAELIRQYYIKALSAMKNVSIIYNSRITEIIRTDSEIVVDYTAGEVRDAVSTKFLLNATYASANQILSRIEDKAVNSKGDFEKFKIKYEQCEIILCNVNERLKGVGITVMDGPFFSIMPFGKSGFHSLTSVTFTPHITCYEELPKFHCQEGVDCSPKQLCNCNYCINKPESAWAHMSNLARKYIRPEFEFNYIQSLYSMKPILMKSEVDDSRPTAIKVNSTKPTIVSVLSGKINTVYDLDDYLEGRIC